MTVPFLKIRYLQCQQKMSGPCVAIVGLLLSIWTNCILNVVCYRDNYYGNSTGYNVIVESGQYSHLLIAVSVTTAMIWGLKKDDRVYLKPWIVTRVLEGIILFIGSIMLATGRQLFIGLLPVGIICLLANGYLAMCMWDTYTKMPEEPSPDPSIPNLASMDQPEKPPSYESFANQTPTV